MEKIKNIDKPIISVQKLNVIFDQKTPDEKVALKNFSYDFVPGKIYFIIGPSGSGKTTLVTHFNGLLKSKYGDIYIKDIAILGKKKKIKQFKKLRKTVSMVFQFPEYQLFKDTIEKDIMFGPVALGDKKDFAKTKAKKYLNKMGLDDSYLPRSPFGLSGGQKRRVAIAGILAIEPEILIFDEPTAGLDPVGEREMLSLIQQAKDDGKTVFVITHVMDQVLEYADEVLVLDNNHFIMSGKPFEIFTNKNLMKKTSLDVPKVVKVINMLVAKDKKYKALYEMRPRNSVQLADAIIKVMKGGK